MVLVIEFVVVNSVWNDKSIVVDKLNVVSCSVTFATYVSTINCDEPWIVVEMMMLVTVDVVIVARLVDQDSYSRMHSVLPFVRALQTFKSTSDGAVPAVSCCHGARR